ncbi:uncharacterized protein LOC121232782 [Aquila chrysaetos chrysaetos]|uniref:uncharacterized protein LOC121232782 n=1 Tax=Aquila chrysaetos chrysaetos TaxID=223781 RepID=UPI001B7D337A|nr:uncharacterized protein LOC121232782 [Aquila chrysaetos chrysaetos]
MGGEQIRADKLYWPVFGSLEDWVCQALNIYVNQKEPFSLEESEYASLWIISSARNHIFALTEKKKTKGPPREQWDPTNQPSPPPYVPATNPPPSPNPSPPPSPPRIYPQLPTHPTPSAPAETEGMKTWSRTQRDQEATQLLPLREVAMGGNQGGVGFVSVPINSGDVREFKKEMGSLLQDPLGVSERLDQFLGPSVYTWDEIQAILRILFTSEERDMIRRSGMRHWDQKHQHGPQGDVKWPLQRPNWDHQVAGDRQNMSDLRDIIIQGIREVVPRGQNINKAFNEYQKKDETPTDWLERLRKSLQLYSGIDPDTAVGQALLKTQFVAKSWVDIRKKLEKLEDWQDRGLDELLREAQKVYVRRDEESQLDQKIKKQELNVIIVGKEGT